MTNNSAELALFVELNPAPVIAFDPDDGTIHHANAAASQAFGEANLKGKSLYQLCRSLHRRQETFQDLGQGDKTFQEEVALGEGIFEFTFRARLHSRLVHGYGADVSTRKAAMEKLERTLTSLKDKEESLASMAAFAELNPAPVFRFEIDGTITMANPKAHEIFGHRTLKGRSWYDISQDSQRSDFEALISRDSIKQLEINLGNERYLFTFRANGNRIHAYGAEISDRIAAEEAITAAKESAERSTQAKSEFLANMSHELRTPLNGIVGMVDLLAESTLTARQLDYARTIQSSSDALLTIVNDILDLSKMEAGQLHLEIVPFNLRSVSEETINLFSAAAREKGIEFILRYSPDHPEMFAGDPLRIRQILSNLMGNALKFTLEGHVDLYIDLKPSPSQDDDERWILSVHVKDCGIGIAPASLQSIFEQFSQEDSSTTRKYGGTGLGLAICSNLTRLMGGTIGVHSTLGEGSDFWFEIPLQLSDHQCTPARNPKREHLDGSRILIVDDIPLNCETIAEQALSWGLDVETCLHPEKALTMLHNAYQGGNPFDFAILDYQMPNMNGVELGEHIRASRDHDELALVLLSSVSLQSKRIDVSENGIDAILEKPVRQAELLATLASVNRKQHERGSSLVSSGVPPNHRLPDERPADIVQMARQPLNLSVLVFEDIPINQQVIASMLGRLGCETHLAGNGQIGLDLLEAGGHYDVILMDCQMPEVDGFQATRAIRASASRYAYLPIIAMTGNAMQGDRELCLAAGMDEYLTKPIKMKTLYQALKSYQPTLALSR